MKQGLETLASGEARRHILAIALLLSCCYLYFFPRWADWNQNSRFDLVLALVEERSVVIDRYVANTGDYARYSGHYYSDKAPGMAILGVPVYWAFRNFVADSALSYLSGAASSNSSLTSTLREGGSGLNGGRSYFFLALLVTTAMTVALPSVVLGVLLFVVGLGFGLSMRQGLAGGLLYGLATSAFPYSNAFVGHQTSAFLLFCAFAIILGIRSSVLSIRWLVAVGFLLGYAAITEYPTVLIGAVLGLYALSISRAYRGAILRLAIGAAPPLLLLAAYDLATFGTPLPVGYSHSELWTDVHHTGFLSLTYPKVDAMWGLTFGEHRGLFFLSPFLLFALPGYVELWRDWSRRGEFWVLLLAPLSFFLFNSSSAMWQGGFAVGPRYMVPSLPFLALVAGIGLASSWSRVGMRPLIVVACTWSVFAVWAETIAGQSFPDYTANPLFDLSLPRLAAGDVARNAGMVVGLPGLMSLLPIMLLGAVVVAVSIRTGGTTPSSGTLPQAAIAE